MNIPLSHTSESHPSIFQRPMTDAALLVNQEAIRDTDPADMWQRGLCRSTAGSYAGNEGSQFTVRYDPKDPPFSIDEVCTLKAALDPVCETFDDRTVLCYAFYSKANLRVLQQCIRYAVNKWSGHVIGDQSQAALVTIMQTVYAAAARHIDERRLPSRTLRNFVRTEVGRLNELVVNAAVPDIADGVEQFKAYLEQAESGHTAASLSRPEDTSVTGTMVFRSPTKIIAASSSTTGPFAR